MTSLFLSSAEIVHLLDDETGRQFNAPDLVGHDRHQVMLLIKRLQRSRQEGVGKLLCALCGTPVYLVSKPDREHFFFRHFYEDGSCPSITRGNLTQAHINALRYQGQRESARHIRLKALMAESLEADPAFSTPVVEGTWKGREGREFRRPDVRSRFRGLLDIAFEVQLSTTFGSVMAEREAFYKSEGGLLLWIFGEFTLSDARLMMEVIFANNNRNAFIVNEATRDASLKAGTLILECCWMQPVRQDDHINWIQHRKLVRFDELTLDADRQRSFYVDTDALEMQIKADIAGPALEERFEEFFLALERFGERERPAVAELNRLWATWVSAFAARGAPLPSSWSDWEFRDLLRCLYLAKRGQAVGWNYKELLPAAHHVFDAEKHYLWIFVQALHHYDRLSAIEAQDNKGKWAWKMSVWEEGRASGSEEFAEDHRFDKAIALIFPTLWKDLIRHESTTND